MCLMVVNITVKTFFFLRIFPNLAPIVVMITRVVYDLRIFLLFYFIMLFYFCLLFSVLGLGNDSVPHTDDVARRFLKAKGGGGSGGSGGGGSDGFDLNADDDGLNIFGRDNGIDPKGVSREYKAVGMLIGGFMWTFRISMGDFSAIGASKTLSETESLIFWVIWFI